MPQVGDLPGGIVFDLEHNSVFKRLTMKFKPGSNPAKICLLLDGAPPMGDATGCAPSFDSESGEMSWEDFQMQIAKGLEILLKSKLLK